MAKVKGSKQEHLVLRPHRPVRKTLHMIIALAFCALALFLSFMAGQYYENDRQKLAPGQIAQFQKLKEKIIALERDRLVDQVALESSRSAIKELEYQITQQNSAISFYRRVMAPESVKQGLQVFNFQAEKIPGSDAYRLSWVVSQAGKNDKFLEGITDLKLTVLRAGERRVLSLDELVEEPPNLAFKLRYFQGFSVELILPQDTEVEQVEVIAESIAPSAQKVSRIFEWVTQEALADAGQ